MGDDLPSGGRRRAASPLAALRSLGEGLLLFILLWWASSRPRVAGFVSGLFCAGYGMARFVVEWFREPDAFLDCRRWTFPEDSGSRSRSSSSHCRDGVGGKKEQGLNGHLHPPCLKTKQPPGFHWNTAACYRIATGGTVNVTFTIFLVIDLQRMGRMRQSA